MDIYRFRYQSFAKAVHFMLAVHQKIKQFRQSLQKYSLKDRVMSVSVAALFIVGLVSIGQVVRLSSLQAHALSKSIQSYALNISSTIGQRFKSQYWKIQELSLAGLDTSKPESQLTSLLHEYLSINYQFKVAVIVDKSGKIISINETDGDGKKMNVETSKTSNVANEAWFKNAINETTVDFEDSGLWGSVVHSYAPNTNSLYKAHTGSGSPTIAYALTIYNIDGEVAGAVSLQTDLDWIKQVFDQVYTAMNAEGLHTSEFHLVQKDIGRLLTHSPILKDGAEMSPLDPDILAETLSGQIGFDTTSDAFAGSHSAVSGYSTLDFDVSPMFGWGVIVNVDKSEVMAGLQLSAIVFYLLIIMIVITSIFLMEKISEDIGRDVEASSTAVRTEITKSSQYVQELLDVSEKVRSTAHSQGQAVTETAAALNEMSAMLGRTEETVDVSIKQAEQVQASAADGKNSLIDLTQAMERIGESKVQMEEVIEIIKEISIKTEAIDSIAFQTKLLAFNASVEAARAGEHGRGFAVVADEVNKLAQMSAVSSREIDEMITRSQDHVHQIVNKISTRIEDGKGVSERVSEQFSAIASEINGIKDQVSHIVEATREQRDGIQSVEEAIEMIDKSTRDNADQAESVTDLAKRSASANKVVEQEMEKNMKTIRGQQSIKAMEILYRYLSNKKATDSSDQQQSPSTKPPKAA